MCAGLLPGRAARTPGHGSRRWRPDPSRALWARPTGDAQAFEEVYVKDHETPREAMQGLGTFFVRYNEWRQHQALSYRTPAAVYFNQEIPRSLLRGYLIKGRV